MLERSLSVLRIDEATERPRSFVHTAALALVWLTFASSGVVFSEPCPTDGMALGLMVLLPVIGLVRVPKLLALFLLVSAVIAATGLVSATFAEDTSKAVTHTLVSLFLGGFTFTIAGFIAVRPVENIKLIFSAITVAAVIAALAGIAGYFSLVPNAEIFTKFGRASGTFKDPNVFGPFLVPPILYAVHIALQGSLRRALPPLMLAGLLALAVFLSFSRGAWINLVVSAGIYLGLSFLTAPTNGRRQKIALLAILCAAALGGVVAGALQNDSVASLVAERASVTQSYDVGPEGRFGGQQKARALILDNPLGIGAAQFSPFYHHEEAHNVYLTVTLATGWLGSGLYLIMVLSTLALGLRQCFKRTPWQPFVLIAFATFAANAAEGIIIDTDHWRHFYVLMALIWGATSASAVRASAGESQRIGVPRIATPSRAGTRIGRLQTHGYIAG
ncbi:MAG: O-antigen ligase family protein [Hyphomicrobium sp.]